MNATKRKRVTAILNKYKKARKSAIVYSPYIEQKMSVLSASAVTTTTLTSGGTAYSLVSIAGGTGRDQRQGNRITVTGFEISWYLSATANAGSIRCVILQDYRTVAATVPTSSTDIFESSSMISGLSINNQGRFKVLYDKTIASTGYVLIKQDTVKCNITTLYKSATGTDFIKNGIYVAFIPQVAGSAATLDYNIRTLFSDV